MSAINLLLRFIALIVSVLVISSIYSTFFLAPSPPTTVVGDENASKNSYDTCGVSNTYSNKDDSQIGVGKAANFMEFPWQAYLHIEYRSGDIYNCVGSLIGDQWILTAAHCLELKIENDRLREVRVSLGLHNYKTVMDGLQRDFYLSSNSFFIHPDYDPTSYAADIALIKLPTAITFSKNIRPICLANWNEHDYDGEQATIAGWSSTFKDDWFEFQQLAVLYKMKVNVMSQSKCKAIDSDITDEMMCTKGNSRGANGQCIISNSDAGSPLIFKRSNGRYRQIGILSYGKNCRKSDHLFYVKVSTYAPWIKQTMKQSSATQTVSFLWLSLFAIPFLIIYLKWY